MSLGRWEAVGGGPVQRSQDFSTAWGFQWMGKDNLGGSSVSGPHVWGACDTTRCDATRWCCLAERDLRLDM